MRKAFTMLELLLVLVIVGAVAALAVPRFSSVQERTRYTSTWSQYGRFESALNLYRSVWHDYPVDALQSNSPSGMSSFMRVRAWQLDPPIGGNWDWNGRRNTSGFLTSDWGVLGPNVSITESTLTPALAARMNLLDALVDDNSQTTGKLRRWRTRFLSMPMEE